MAASSQPHPAVQYLKENIVVIGLVVIVAASVAFYLLTQGGPKPEPAGKAVPAPVATAALGPAATAPGSPVTPPGPAGSPGVSAAAQATPAPSPTPTSTPAQGSGGTQQQSVVAQDWRPPAAAFAKAWGNHEGGKDAWLARIKPLVAPSLFEGFTRTDLSKVPADTFDSVTMAEESPRFKTFRAYFRNTGHAFVGRVVIQTDGSWLVDQVGPPQR